MGHPNLVNLDALEEQVIDRGPLQGRRVRVGPAVGASRCGLSLYRLGPGQRAMPVHVHADEEEHCFVLSGSGLSWQDGRTHRVAAGDLLVHLAGGAPHALVGGEQGLEALIFGTGSATGLTWLPRAGAWWLGPRWLPSDGPSPFTLEARTGPLEAPEPQADPPPHAASVASAAVVRTERPGYRESYRRLGAEAGSVRAGLIHGTLAPRQHSCPQHWHSAEEEAFVVLEGRGEALLGDERHPLRPGDVLWRPPGTHVGHALRAGAEPMTYLVFVTRVSDDVAFYPRSGKLNLGGGVIFRPELLDYYDGEELDDDGRPVG
jgi:uncharacterized cupin superfamily protein